MSQNTSDDIRQIIKKAKDDEKEAKTAADIVNDATSDMISQRTQNDQSKNNH
ncbi:hypothetical protein [Halalkalibacter flavus]|uniref:hypothetical protein n=1 Tax=Halalkalibacter flavus TaxID=3090668 RepID=UPI002FC76B26